MIKGMTLSKGGSRLPLILGLILGLVAAVLVVVYLTSAKDEGGTTSGGGSGDFKVTGPYGESNNDIVAGTVLQNVKVLAIDQERTNPNPAAGTNPDQSKQENQAATTVTLSLNPSQAEVIAVVDQCGKAHGGRLAMSLRGPGDPNKRSNRAEWPAGGPIPSCAAILGVATLGG